MAKTVILSASCTNSECPTVIPGAVTINLGIGTINRIKSLSELCRVRQLNCVEDSIHATTWLDLDFDEAKDLYSNNGFDSLADFEVPVNSMAVRIDKDGFQFVALAGDGNSLLQSASIQLDQLDSDGSEIFIS